jgi:aspartate carbamoyltransferase catalytic subunit
MMELGGNVIGFSQASSSSAAKGESVSDTAKMISCYADIMAMRHNMEGAPYVAAKSAWIPVINAGDGGHCHPTQTLTDLLTIYRELGRLHDLTVGFCGDLKYGRTVHSLISALGRYQNIKIILIAPEELQLPDYIKHEVLEKNNMQYEETASLDGAMPELDVLYMTRIQRERFDSAEKYEELKDSYILTAPMLEYAKPEMRILHPLPRVNEISIKVDADPRAAYFRQALNGKFVRMALILKLLKEAQEGRQMEDEQNILVDEIICDNPRCITATEQEITHKFKCVNEEKGIYRCIYCEAKKRRV